MTNKNSQALKVEWDSLKDQLEEVEAALESNRVEWNRLNAEKDLLKNKIREVRKTRAAVLRVEESEAEIAACRAKLAELEALKAAADAQIEEENSKLKLVA